MIKEQKFLDIETLIEERDKGAYTITLDWLSMYFKNLGLFNETYEEGEEIILSEDITLTSINRPTLHFNTHFVLFYKKEECAHVLMHSKNKTFFAPDVVKVEYSNHTLYSGVWQLIYDALTLKGLRYTSCSRIDIAIDGVGYLQKLMNVYAKQNLGSESLLLKNNSEKRSIFSAKVLNPKTRLFENFNIGSGSGNKMITIYNKSLEIVKSQKNYIQEFWLKNGIIDKLSDLKAQALQINTKETGAQTYNILGQKNIYRFEIRLKSESIKEIKNFNIQLLKSPEGLISIVRTHCRKYFEACLNDNNNVTRCSTIDLLPYDKFGGKLIAKIKRVEKDGLYKAKLGIHGLIQDLYKDYINKNSINETIEVIRDRVEKYKLEDYLRVKLPEWQKKYKKFIDKTQIETLNFIMSEIGNIIDNTNDLADRNGNSYATAMFGD